MTEVFKWNVPPATRQPLEPMQNKIFALSQHNQKKAMSFTGRRPQLRATQTQLVPGRLNPTNSYQFQSRPQSQAAYSQTVPAYRFTPPMTAYNRVGQNKRLSATIPTASSLPPLRQRALDQHIHNAYQTCARFNSSSAYGTGRKASHITHYQENLLRKH